jgi:hypothetical protein
VNSASVYLACQLDFPAQVLSANVCLLTRSMPRVLFRGEACLWHTQYNPTRRRSQSSDCHWAQTFPKAKSAPRMPRTRAKSGESCT